MTTVEARGTGRKDYSQNVEYISEPITKSAFNIDELSARISPYFSVDRKGTLLWHDDFESLATKWVFIPSTIGTAVISGNRAWTGDNSLKITTDAVIGDSLTFVKVLSAPFIHQNGLETCFFVSTGKPSIEFYLDGYNGGYYYEAGFRYDYNTATIYYENESAGWMALPKKDPVEPTREHWVPVKIVADWDKLEYVRVLFGGTQYDLGGIKLYSVASSTQQHIRPQIKTIAETNDVATVFFGHVIVTNE